MAIAENLKRIKTTIPPKVKLVVVSKTRSIEAIMDAYDAGQKIFGENKVQELIEKYPLLPKDIEWHHIGHLQTNKVKFIAPFVKLIHAVDSLKLLQEINKQALKNNRIQECLLQIYIAKEETKFGVSFEEAENLLMSEELKKLKNIKIVGLMGMATNTDNVEQIRGEFYRLKSFFEKLTAHYSLLTVLSMGMSGDYKIAIEEGSTLIRVGSAIFEKQL